MPDDIIAEDTKRAIDLLSQCKEDLFEYGEAFDITGHKGIIGMRLRSYAKDIETALRLLKVAKE